MFFLSKILRYFAYSSVPTDAAVAVVVLRQLKVLSKSFSVIDPPSPLLFCSLLLMCVLAVVVVDL